MDGGDVEYEITPIANHVFTVFSALYLEISDEVTTAMDYLLEVQSVPHADSDNKLAC